jgi:cell division protein FtsB
MRPDQLDPDMLEERARLMLSVGHPDEVVILPLD